MTQLTQLQARRVIASRWITSWAALHPDAVDDPLYVPYQIDNEQFTEPAHLRLDGTPMQWARLTVRHLPDAQFTLGAPGNRIYRRTANIWVQLFTANGQGLEELDVLSDQVRSIFEGVSFGGIDPAGAADVNEIGTANHWYEVAITLPVTYYELK